MERKGRRHKNDLTLNSFQTSPVEDEPGAAGGALLLVPVLQQQRVRVVGQGLARAADHLLRHHRLRLE